MSGTVIAVASGKGGVGKTTTVVNLGVTLRADDNAVALVDADLGMANLGTFLGIDHEPTLHDVLAGEATLDEALTEQAERFGILPGSRDLERYVSADPAELDAVLEELATRYEYVLVDTGAGVGFEDVLPLELVDEIVLVAAPDRAALGDAEKTAEISGLLDVSIRGLVLTMTDESDDVAAIAGGLDVDLLAAIPEDPAVPKSTAEGRPLEAFAPESPAAEGYRELAAALTGREVARFEPPEASGSSASEPGTEGSDEEPAPQDDEPSVEPDRSDGEDADAGATSGSRATTDASDDGGTAAAEETPAVEDGADEADRTEDDDGAAEAPGDGEPTDSTDDRDGPSGDATAESDRTDENDGGSGGLLARLGGLFG